MVLREYTDDDDVDVMAVIDDGGDDDDDDCTHVLVRSPTTAHMHAHPMMMTPYYSSAQALLLQLIDYLSSVWSQWLTVHIQRR